MDPQSRQRAKYTTRHLMGVMSDRTAVGLAKLKGYEFQEIDIAIIKATLQNEVVPKEKHVRTLKINAPSSAPRQQVMYIIRSLADRLQKSQGWLVTLKTLMVFHRLMREVDQSFEDEVVKFQERYGPRHILRLDTYADHTTKDTWDYSSWIRCYSIYLDERLDAFRALKFDPEQDNHERDTKLKNCEATELLEALPKAQRLLGRLVACLPEGAAAHNIIVNQAAAWVLKESRAVYRLASEGVMNLADKYFEMTHADALKGLELYRENVALNDRMNRYYATVQQNPVLRGVITFPTLQSLPADFLTTMEEYIKEAPRSLDAPRPRSNGVAVVEPPPPPPPEPEPEPEPEPPKPPVQEVDLLDFGPETPKAPAASTAPAGPADPLDALMNPTPHQNGTNGFGDLQQQQQQANGFGQPNPMAQSYDPQATGGFPQQGAPGYAPQYTGAPGYHPQMTGYPQQYTGMDPYGMQPGYMPMQTGYGAPSYGAPGFGAPGYGPGFGQNPGAESTALVLYQGPGFGMPGMAPNPFMGGVPPRGPSSSGGTNPFRTSQSGAPPNPMFEAKKMANDPLNHISTDLFAPKVEAPKPSVPLKDMKRVLTQNGEAPAM